MRSQRNTAALWAAGLVLLVGMVGLLTWANLRYTTANTDSGADFLVHWMGTRSFLGEGISPYSRETTQRVAEQLYGRVPRNGEFQPYWYSPLYAFFLFIPFSMISDFALSRAIWMTVLEIALITLSFFSIRLVRWRVNWILLGLFLFFSVFWFHGLRPLIDGNLVILVALIFAAALWAVREQSDELAGVLLGISTLKPQLVVLPILLIVLWTLRQRRSKVVIWLAMTVFIFGAVSALLLPDWILQNARVLINLPEGIHPGNPADAFTQIWPALGARLGRGFSIAVAVLILVEWLFALRADFRGLLWTVCLTLTASQWVGFSTEPENFIMLFLPLTLVFSVWEERWRRLGGAFVFAGMLMLFGGIWWIYYHTTGTQYVLVLDPILLLPLPGFLLIALYWVRWWAVQPPNVWYDLLLDARK